MSTPQPAVVVAGCAATLNLFRLFLDLIIEASIKDDKVDVNKSNNPNQKNESKAKSESTYGTVFSKKKNGSNTLSTTSISSTGNTTSLTETTSLISNANSNIVDDEFIEKIDAENPTNPVQDFLQSIEPKLSDISLVVHCGILVFFFFDSFIFKATPLGNAVYTMIFGIILNIRDKKRARFVASSRFLFLSSAATLLVAGLIVQAPIAILAILLYLVLAIIESRVFDYPKTSARSGKKATLSTEAIFILLKPYCWPDATTNSAALNRILVILTWVCVIAAKVCSLVAPIYLGKASTALSQFQYTEAIYLSVYFALLSFFSKLFKEGQSLFYLKVAQAAFVQLSEAAFHHIHTLSLDWHLRKKLGDVIRSMDRGISACDTLMKYLFLWLMPAIAECILVCIIFASYFKYFPLSVVVFFFVVCYMVMTIVMTLWRKKFRKAVAKSDNDWHDRCTDSLINFETVKYFTGEEYEKERFAEAVSTYQSGSVYVQASLSLLNTSQQVLIQTCLALALGLAVMGIKQRLDCCSSHGCDIFDSNCCADVGQVTCPGMEIGDFVAVYTYTVTLFAPLNFLGSVYNAIVMAFVDLTNLSELLAEEANVVDASDALELPRENDADPDIAVEFDNVYFNYPTQPENSGLKGLSFKMKKGTITAVVGSTGAGKTTVSRLFFRFYDVLHGAVKINGVDVRSVTQKSLRSAIGVVPQSATMFNDTIRANVIYGKRDATQEELDQAMRDSQLEDFISSLPLGWDTVVGDRGLKLSGGEKQRTAIARCLLKNPPFVVLDEATSALDTITENSVQEALDRLGQDRTVLVIAHRLGTVRNADNIVVLDDGVVLEQGTHDELMELNGKYAELWNMQLHSTGSSHGSLSHLKVLEEES